MEVVHIGLRWPIVTQLLNITIDSAHRATIISLGSFSNHLGFALCAPIFGFVTDLHGIKFAFRIAAFSSLLLVPVFGLLQSDVKIHEIQKISEQ